jgi:hypothetical protein
MSAIAADATDVAIGFRQGDNAYPRELPVLHREFPNYGGWSFFVAACSWAAQQGGMSAKARHPEVRPASLP